MALFSGLVVLHHKLTTLHGTTAACFCFCWLVPGYIEAVHPRKHPTPSMLSERPDAGHSSGRHQPRQPR